jgi:ATP-dependent Clp protease ATP-binding subunit ClpA
LIFRHQLENIRLSESHATVNAHNGQSPRCGHKLELDKAVLPFLVRKGFHPKLGARPMRDAVEKLVGDAAAECLLGRRAACGVLGVDEERDCLVIR